MSRDRAPTVSRREFVRTGLLGAAEFDLTQTGGVGVVWEETRAGIAGGIVVTARHSVLGAKSVTITAKPGAPA